MRRSNWLTIGAGLALLGGGCAKANVQTVADGPPLSVPAPPPRVVVSEPPSVEPPPPVAARSPARPPVSEPEAKPAEPPRTLRPGPSTADATEERRVRDLLARAARDLARIDYRTLSSGGRTQYDQSKRFSDQAETAIKARNLVFAQTLAEKAATLAAGLSGR